MKTLLFHCEKYQSTKLNISLMLMRLFFGLSMAFAHGLKKVPPQEGFIKYITSLSLPLPEVMAWSAGLSEFIGGLFIAIGLGTRFFGATWVITMFVAAFVAHADDPFGKKEMALSYLIVGIFLLLSGPGKFSIDAMINKK